MNVVITGVSRGIGLELAKEALSKGDQVLAIARAPEESPGLTDLRRKFPKTLTVEAVDLSAPEADAKIASAAAAWPHVDVLINNAGIYREGEKIEDFLASFQVNSVVPFLVTKALLLKLRKASSPRVVQITSAMGSIADNTSGGSYAYRSSKAALNMINKCFAIENPWLTTIVIHPGWVKTDMGGQEALVEPEESVAGIWHVTRDLKPGDSGKFYDFRGKILAW